MKVIWYLLKCQEGNETDYAEKCREFIGLENLEEVICFKYQRMLRYRGSWHLENRALLPGCIFLSGIKNVREKGTAGVSDDLIPCKVSQLKALCSEENLIGISKGIIENGIPVVTSGPLKGKERLIRRIDRHKRLAEIEVSLAGNKVRMVVGLEVYEKY